MLKDIYSLKALIYRLRGLPTTEELISRGMKVGEGLFRGHDVLLDNVCCWLLEMGDHVVLVDHVKIFCHDASTKRYLGYTKAGAVKIGSRVFVGAGTVILPNVTIGDDVIIGAGSVVNHDIPSRSVAAGNPARVICTLDEYLEKERARMQRVHVWDKKETAELRRVLKKQEEARELIKQDGISFLY